MNINSTIFKTVFGLLIIFALMLAPGLVKGQYSGTGTFTKITSLTDLTDGNYVVAYGTTFAMNNTNAASFFGNTAITPSSNVITNPATTIVWQIKTHIDGGRTIYNEASTKYVSYTGSSNAAYAVATVTGGSERWTFVWSSTVFTVTNITSSTRLLQYNTGSPRFACYTGSQQNITLYKMASDPPSITLSDNGTQVSIGNVTQGTSNNILHKFSLAVSTANASLTGMTCTTAGTYVSADITNLKVWYSSDNTFNSDSDVLLSTLTTPGIAGLKTFSSFTPQAINSGSTGYVFVTADVYAGATANNTISLNAIAPANLTFASGTPTGSTTAGGAQTIVASTTPAIFLNASLNAFSAVSGTASASQSYTVSGDNLTTNVVVTAPAKYEVSTDNSAFSASVELVQSGGNIVDEPKTVYVRIAANAAVGAASGNITHESAGANTENVALSGTVYSAEPTNHPTAFTANTSAPTSSNIVVAWVDATGGTVPENYLIKASPTSYAAILAPVDGTPEADAAPLVKNIAQGAQTASFTGLSAGTTYYFKIYPYTNSSININFKTDGIVQQSTATTDFAPTYSVGDFGFTAASGSWGTANTNWKQWDGSGWNTTPSAVPSATDNVYILAGKVCTVEVGGKNCKNLTVESSGKLYTANTTMGTPRYLNVSGNITCNGTIGNGGGTDDVISFNITGGLTSTISGTGSFTANRLRRNSGAGILTLYFDMDIELRYNGEALYNATSAPDATQSFNVTINSGKHVNLTGNGATHTAGYTLKSVDLATIYGKLTVTGTFTNSGTASSLVIKSDASGTGSLITSSTPDATVERYLTNYSSSSDKKYHFLSSPVALQAIQPGFVADPPASDVDFFSWDIANGKWKNSKNDAGTWNTNFETTFGVGKGYLVAYPTAPVTKNFTGALNSAASNLLLTCFYNDTKGNGWNLLGNPFPSAIDYAQINSTRGDGMDAALYYYDAATSNYLYYIKLSDGSIGSGSQYIPSMQGFMVHAKSTGTKTITLNNSQRVHTGQTTYYKSSETVPTSLSLAVSAGGFKDEMFVHFRAGATTQFDGEYDAYKLPSYSAQTPQIYTTTSDQIDLAINGLPQLSEGLEIPVSFKAGIFGQQTITADVSQVGSTVFLTDLKTSATQNLRANPTYNFTAADGDATSRFVLRFAGVGMNEATIAQLIVVYTAGNAIYVGSKTGALLKGDVFVYNMIGQTILHQQLGETPLTRLNFDGATGYYIVKVVTPDNLVTRKVFFN